MKSTLKRELNKGLKLLKRKQSNANEKKWEIISGKRGGKERIKKLFYSFSIFFLLIFFSMHLFLILN